MSNNTKNEPVQDIRKHVQYELQYVEQMANPLQP